MKADNRSLLKNFKWEINTMMDPDCKTVTAWAGINFRCLCIVYIYYTPEECQTAVTKHNKLFAERQLKQLLIGE